MAKRILSLLLAACLVFALVGCGGKETGENTSQPDDTSSKVEEVIPKVNALTGLPISEDIAKNRPVAVMINNAKPAQKVQTGLNDFDIVYETEVEGGITRLLGVSKNIKDIPKIGTIRSARLPHLMLALGHDAVYIHAGRDTIYFGPYRESHGIKTIDVNNREDAMRENPEGLASEHTLFSTGEKLSAAVDKYDLPRTTEKNVWLKFNAKDNVRTPANACKTISVPFSSSYVTDFEYDAESGKFVRMVDGAAKVDYNTKEKVAFQNVFVLFTDIVPYDDNYHMNVHLAGGKGYYATAGGYEEITWTKGGATTSINIKTLDGTEFTANAGNSYICIVDNGQQEKVSLSAE